MAVLWATGAFSLRDDRGRCNIAGASFAGEARPEVRVPRPPSTPLSENKPEVPMCHFDRASLHGSFLAHFSFKGAAGAGLVQVWRKIRADKRTKPAKLQVFR